MTIVLVIKVKWSWVKVIVIVIKVMGPRVDYCDLLGSMLERTLPVFTVTVGWWL